MDKFVKVFIVMSIVYLGVFALLTAWGVPGSAQAAEPQRECLSMQVPVTVPEIPDASVYGELCVPAGGTPTKVQLLVHGATYTHAYFDWPQEPETYSYVDKALEAGYATFNVDCLGSGQSTRPYSEQVTLQNIAEALHDVITQLRNGQIGGRTFAQVYWVGHSFGSVYGWVEASMYQDVDAFVLTGLLHSTKPSWVAMALPNYYPASMDPEFDDLGLDYGYLTSLPGTRGDLFYYTPGADAEVIALDEELKDTVTVTELVEGALLYSSPPPETAPSRQITVPTLLMLGEHDGLFCGPPDGADCTVAGITALEGPYYSPQAHLQVAIIHNTGHDIGLHLKARVAANRIIDWLEDEQ